LEEHATVNYLVTLVTLVDIYSPLPGLYIERESTE
jgi:hypothetical protein